MQKTLSAQLNLPACCVTGERLNTDAHNAHYAHDGVHKSTYMLIRGRDPEARTFMSEVKLANLLICDLHHCKYLMSERGIDAREYSSVNRAIAALMTTPKTQSGLIVQLHKESC